MSFAESIAALRNLFKVSAELPLAAAVDEMRSFMSIEATGSLVRGRRPSGVTLGVQRLCGVLRSH